MILGLWDIKKETVPVYIAHKSEIDSSDPDPFSGNMQFAVMGLYNVAVCVS